jgi:hypothetical protein
LQTASSAVAEHTANGERDVALAAEPPPAGPAWDEGVLQALYEAAFSQPGTEIVGVLVGHPSSTSMPPRIAAMIPASTARFPDRAQLDHEAWSYVHATMARYYAGLDIVGWWVSRPGPNAELDVGELRAASESFSRPSQFGFVFDSHHRQAALYGWQGGRYVRIHEGPVPRWLTRPRRRQASPWRPALTAFGCGIGAGVIGWLVAGKPGL